MENVQLKTYSEWDCHTIYDLLIDGKYTGQVEVQFDSGKFNGHILFTKFNSEDENGEYEWNPVTDKELYEFIKEQAIKDYKQ